MNFLIDPLKNDENYENLIADIRSKSINNFYIHGMVDKSTGLFSYSLRENLNRPVFVVFENEYKAKKAYEAFHMDDSFVFFPELESNTNNIKSLDVEVKSMRIKTIERLIEGENLLVFASLSALQNKLTNYKQFLSLGLNINLKTPIEIDDFSQKLLDLGYEKSYSVESMGQFSVRGGIIDIYPVNRDPVRLELFGDEIDSIRSFEISSQRSIENIDEFKICPIDEFHIPKDRYLDIGEKIGSEVKNAYKKGISKDNIDRKFSKILDLLEEKIVINPDLLIPYVDSDVSSILEYCEDPLIVFNDLSRVYDLTRDSYIRFMDSVQDSIAKGDLLYSHNEILFSLDEIFKKIKKYQNINLSLLLKRMKILYPEKIIELKSLEVEKFNTRWSDFSEFLKKNIYKAYKIVISTSSKNDLTTIAERLEEDGIIYELKEDPSGEIKSSQVFLLEKDLSEGFIYPSIKMIFLSYKDIFGRERKRSRPKYKKINKKDLMNYEDLEVGQYVVHDSYGIGRYMGLEQVNYSGISKDFLILQYGKTDKLYIPTEEMNLISKYIGNEHPSLSKLGSTEWSRAKQKVKKSIEEIADDLVELYAERANIEGFKFSKDTPWQREFEESFIYEETPSQLRVIEEIKRDMESSKAMDRLLCGDVGYGKTEVALRAAFKAVMDGKQVAILVPTTILCQQHYKTMLDRFRDFPIKVDYISRFKTSTEKKKTVEEIKNGRLDIVVGTHNLLSSKISFDNLGLLIIDEEQRFGVRHKDKIKSMKKNLDVLTLSATPIPRTMQLSLTGIRDMSILEEPPQDRSPVNTYVLEYDRSIIREAILSELARGGQVYFVYNRVYDIDKMKSDLEDLVPEAEIAMAHGQMRPKELENIMVNFYQNNYDVLLSTTIIETGMDIQNVNTLIVYNADKMGLAQLYQLKGRIGRGDRSSYAYFTYERGKVVSESSEKRLKAIKDFTSFGSGYKIAMRDLELRGAGNILGESQSGHINSVGYDLYVRLLEEEINKIKGLEKREDRIVNIDLKVDTFIPSDYIEDVNKKISTYREIANIDNEEDYDKIFEELIDIYGDLPKTVVNIMDLAYIKAMCIRSWVSEISEYDNKVIISFDGDKFNLRDFGKLASEFKKSLHFDVANGIKVILDSSKEKLRDIKTLLEILDRNNKGEEK